METELRKYEWNPNPSFLGKWKSKIPSTEIPLLNGYMEFLFYWEVTCLQGKDLGLRRRETSYPCGMEEEEGGHVEL